MVDAAKLKDLLARIEAATEGDNDLDRDIAIALGWVPPAIGLPFWRYDDGNHWGALPDWSTSIDAAVALVERVSPGAEYEISTIYHVAHVSLPLNDGDRCANVRRADMNVPLAILAALLRSIEGGERG